MQLESIRHKTKKTYVTMTVFCFCEYNLRVCAVDMKKANLKNTESHYEGRGNNTKANDLACKALFADFVETMHCCCQDRNGRGRHTTAPVTRCHSCFLGHQQIIPKRAKEEEEDDSKSRESNVSKPRDGATQPTGRSNDDSKVGQYPEPRISRFHHVDYPGLSAGQPGSNDNSNVQLGESNVSKRRASATRRASTKSKRASKSRAIPPPETTQYKKLYNYFRYHARQAALAQGNKKRVHDFHVDILIRALAGLSVFMCPIISNEILLMMSQIWDLISHPIRGVQQIVSSVFSASKCAPTLFVKFRH